MDEKRRPIRSYVLRQGRMTRSQQQALETLWPRYGIDDTDRLLDLESVFGNTRPVTLEIGFGNGESLVEQASNHPENNYIGIEVHGPGVGHCLIKAEASDLENLRVMRADATIVLERRIRDASLHCVQLFFPDPWHKKKHHKRRILKRTFIDCVHQRLTTDGSFHMATDWEDYADHMKREMAEHSGFELVSTERGERPETHFERRGLRLGHGVWDLIYHRI